MKNLIMSVAAFLAFGYASAQTDPTTSSQPRTSTGSPVTGQGSQPGEPGMKPQTIPADTAHSHTTRKAMTTTHTKKNKTGIRKTKKTTTTTATKKDTI